MKTFLIKEILTINRANILRGSFVESNHLSSRYRTGTDKNGRTDESKEILGDLHRESLSKGRLRKDLKGRN